MSQLASLSAHSPHIQRTSAPATPQTEIGGDAMRLDLHQLAASSPALQDQFDTSQVMKSLPETLSQERLDELNDETHATLEVRAMNAAADGSAPLTDGTEEDEAALEAEGAARMARILRDTVGLDEPDPVAGTTGTQGTQSVQEMPTRQDVLDNVSSVRPGMTLDNVLSLAKLEARRDQIAVMAKELHSDSEHNDVDARLLAPLMKLQTQIQNAIISRGHLSIRLEMLGEMAQADLPPAEKLKNITDTFSPVWQASLAQDRAIQTILSSASPEQKYEAIQLFGWGISMLGDDRVTFERELTLAMADQVAQLAPECHLGRDALASLCLLSLHTGSDPVEMQALLSSAPKWAFTPEHEAALTKAMAQGIADAHSGSDSPQAARMTTLRWVDMLFQGAKFEASEQALAFKKLLMPGHEAEAELQHQCMTASSHLFNKVLAKFSGSAASSMKTRTGTLDRAAEGVSAHSLLLTPQLVGTLSAKVRIPDFNYHLAHVALLQKRAMQAGLFENVPIETKKVMMDAGKWCSTLGLDEATARYADELDRKLDGGGAAADGLLKQLIGASAHFVQGFEGQSGLEKAGRSVLGAAKMTGTLGHERRSSAMYSTSPDYKARAVLDSLVMNLASTEAARKRFAEGGEGFAFNGELIDGGIRERTGQALREMLASSREANALFSAHDAAESLDIMDTTLETALADRAITQREALKEAKELRAKLALMDDVARASHEITRLVGQYKTLSDDIAAKKQAADSVSFSWPHKHAARDEVCRTVLEIARANREVERLRAGMASTPENAPLLAMAERKLQEHLDALSGVHPLSLVPRSKLAGKTPSLDVVLKHMLPRAEALRYFNQPTYPLGRRSTRAKEALSRLDQLSKQLLDQQKIIDKGLKDLSSLVGSKPARRLHQTVSAAVLKVYAESQSHAEDFSVNDAATRARIMDQLRSWGIDPDIRLLNMVIRLTMREMTDGNGRLRETWLDRTMKNMDNALASETARADLRAEGSGWLSARFQAWRKVDAMLASDKRKIHEGVRGLMDKASLPGSGFTYSRSRGLNVDTGAIFSPLSGDNALVTTVDLSNLLSVRFKAMHDNSVTVANLGGNKYQVMLKGGLTGSLGATMKFKLGAGFTAPVGGNLSGSHGEGIALTFTSRADTEAFLRAFMDPESGLHPEPLAEATTGTFGGTHIAGRTSSSPDARRGDGYDPAVWLKASQIRFVTDNSVSMDFSVGLMHGLLTNIPLPPALSVSGTLNFTAQGSLTSSVEQNHHGETATFSLKGRITGVESVSAGILGDGGTKLYGSPKSTQKAIRTMDVEQRFKLVTGEEGIMPGTCMETELTLSGAGSRLVRALFLPPGMAGRVNDDPEFAERFNSFLHGLPPSSRLTVRYALKPAVLADVRERFLQARLAEPSRRDALLRQVHALLEDTDSYEAASLQVKGRKPTALSKNWSPGLGHVQYKRETSFAQFVPLRTMEL